MGPAVGIVYDTRMCAHENPISNWHPEQPTRITSIWAALESSDVLERCVRVPAREATDDELTSVHTDDHIKIMRSVSSKSNKKRASLADRYNSVYLNEGSSQSALLAAGSVIELSQRVAQGELSAGAAIVRPPGHHAEADKAMGFCLFNNVAVAAHILAHEEASRKVLIVDWDVHHGNGTQHMFWEDPNVLYFSVHRYDGGLFYPQGDEGNYDQVGKGPGAGFNINVPWPHCGFGDSDYVAVWDHILMPVAHEFAPDIVLISGGFDSAQGDPLGGCCLTPPGYSYMTKKLMALAGGRVVLALEGGYNLDAISRSYLACVQTLLGDMEVDPDTIQQCSFDSTWSVIDTVRMELSRYWPVLSGKIDKPSTTKAFGPKEVIYIESSSEEEIMLDNLEQVPSEMDNLEPVSSGIVSIVEVLEHLALQPEMEPSMLKIKTTLFQDLKSTYVWYATFGSNMYRPRLMCYIEGGKVEGGMVTLPGLPDKTPPLDDFWLSVPHRLFFGRTASTTWGPGGVAFLDPKENNDEISSSYIRAYKITLEQFNGIVAGENKLDPLEHGKLVSLVDLEALKMDNPPCLEVVKGAWYGAVLYLGEKDGIPILTITCSVEDAGKYSSGDLPSSQPTDAYRDTIVKGLLDKGMDEGSALDYISLRM